MKMKATKKSLILGFSVLALLIGIFWFFSMYTVNTSVAQLKSDDWKVREQAAKNLTKIGKPAVEPLISVLEGDDEDIRWQAAYSLGKIGDDRAIEPLIAALEDEDKRVRYRAVEALGRIGGSQVMEPLISILNYDEDIDIQNKASQMMALLGKSAIEPVAFALEHNDDNVPFRVECLYILSRIYLKTNDDDALNAIINALLNDKNEFVRNRTLWILDNMNWGAESKNERIKSLIEKEGWDICIGIGDPAMDLLVDSLQDEDTNIRQSALSTLVKMTGEDFGTNFYRWRMWREQKRERDKQW